MNDKFDKTAALNAQFTPDRNEEILSSIPGKRLQTLPLRMTTGMFHHRCYKRCIAASIS